MRARFLTVGQERNREMGISRLSLGYLVGIGGISMSSQFLLCVEKDGWMDGWRNKYRHVCVNIYISQHCVLRGSRSNDTPVAMSTLCVQVLIFKSSLTKQPRLPLKIRFHDWGKRKYKRSIPIVPKISKCSKKDGNICNRSPQGFWFPPRHERNWKSSLLCSQ